jgi:hypothetical protein
MVVDGQVVDVGTDISVIAPACPLTEDTTHGHLGKKGFFSTFSNTFTLSFSCKALVLPFPDPVRFTDTAQNRNALFLHPSIG